LGELPYIKKGVYNQEKHPFFVIFAFFVAKRNKKGLFNCDV